MFSFKRKARRGPCLFQTRHYHGWQWSSWAKRMQPRSCGMEILMTIAAKRWACRSWQSMPFQQTGRDQKKKCPSLWIAGWVLWPLCRNCTETVKIQMIGDTATKSSALRPWKAEDLTFSEYRADFELRSELRWTSWNQSSGSKALPKLF